MQQIDYFFGIEKKLLEGYQSYVQSYFEPVGENLCKPRNSGFFRSIADMENLENQRKIACDTYKVSLDHLKVYQRTVTIEVNVLE